MDYRKIRVGEKTTNNSGETVEIVEYFNKKNITVKFESGHVKTNVFYKNFKNGFCKNPYYPSVCTIGYIGDGKIKVETNRAIYDVWKNMLERCYLNDKNINNKTYKGFSVEEKWHNFQNFYTWYNNNFYKLPNNERLNIDKDILENKDKMYSENTCILIPQSINVLFTNYSLDKTCKYKGVYFHKNSGKYKSQISVNNKQKSLGTFDNAYDAHVSYINEKNKVFKTVLNRYKKIMPQQLFLILSNYEFKYDEK